MEHDNTAQNPGLCFNQVFRLSIGREVIVKSLIRGTRVLKASFQELDECFAALPGISRTNIIYANSTNS